MLDVNTKQSGNDNLLWKCLVKKKEGFDKTLDSSELEIKKQDMDRFEVTSFEQLTQFVENYKPCENKKKINNFILELEYKKYEKIWDRICVPIKTTTNLDDIYEVTSLLPTTSHRKTREKPEANVSLQFYLHREEDNVEEILKRTLDFFTFKYPTSFSDHNEQIQDVANFINTLLASEYEKNQRIALSFIEKIKSTADKGQLKKILTNLLYDPKGNPHIFLQLQPALFDEIYSSFFTRDFSKKNHMATKLTKTDRSDHNNIILAILLYQADELYSHDSSKWRNHEADRLSYIFLSLSNPENQNIAIEFLTKLKEKETNGEITPQHATEIRSKLNSNLSTNSLIAEYFPPKPELKQLFQDFKTLLELYSKKYPNHDPLKHRAQATTAGSISEHLIQSELEKALTLDALNDVFLRITGYEKLKFHLEKQFIKDNELHDRDLDLLSAYRCIYLVHDLNHTHHNRTRESLDRLNPDLRESQIKIKGLNEKTLKLYSTGIKIFASWKEIKKISSHNFAKTVEGRVKLAKLEKFITNISNEIDKIKKASSPSKTLRKQQKLVKKSTPKTSGKTEKNYAQRPISSITLQEKGLLDPYLNQLDEETFERCKDEVFYIPVIALPPAIKKAINRSISGSLFLKISSNKTSTQIEFSAGESTEILQCHITTEKITYISGPNIAADYRKLTIPLAGSARRMKSHAIFQEDPSKALIDFQKKLTTPATRTDKKRASRKRNGQGETRREAKRKAGPHSHLSEKLQNIICSVAENFVSSMILGLTLKNIFSIYGNKQLPALKVLLENEGIQQALSLFSEKAKEFAEKKNSPGINLTELNDQIRQKLVTPQATAQSASKPRDSSDSTSSSSDSSSSDSSSSDSSSSDSSSSDSSSSDSSSSDSDDETSTKETHKNSTLKQLAEEAAHTLVFS